MQSMIIGDRPISMTKKNCNAETSETDMNQNAILLEKFKKLPQGLWLFTKLICAKAPYFASIKPRFILLTQGEGQAVVKKRRSVTNHLGTVHAIAMANLAELVAGTTLEISLPSSHRWIPKSMKIDYLKKASTDVIAKTKFSTDDLPEAAGVKVIHVDIYDTANTPVVTADIEMYISARPK